MRHHKLKHETGWQVKLLPAGATEWTDPAGHTYLVQPHTHPLDTTTRSIVRLTDNPSPVAEWGNRVSSDVTGGRDRAPTL